MSADEHLNKTQFRDVPAEEIAVGHRLSRKTRITKVHDRGDHILVQIKTQGARSPSIESYEKGSTVRIWEQPK